MEQHKVPALSDFWYYELQSPHENFEEKSATLNSEDRHHEYCGSHGLESWPTRMNTFSSCVD